MRNFLLAALLALLAAPLAYAQSAGYRIQPGDQLAITVLEDETLNRTALVLPDGRISVPLAGTINAAGRTVDAVESAIADRLASNFAVRPSVFVSVTTVSDDRPSTFPIYVRRPGRRPGPDRGRGRHHPPPGDRARRRARPLRRDQAHPAPPHRRRDRPGAALSLQLQRRRARRRDPVDDHAARRRRDPRSRTPPLRVKAAMRRATRRPDPGGLAGIRRWHSSARRPRPDLADTVAGRPRSAGRRRGAGRRRDGSVLTATVSRAAHRRQQLQLDDPSPGTSYYADTRLALGYRADLDPDLRARARHRPARALGGGQPSSSSSPRRAPRTSPSPRRARHELRRRLRFRSRRVDSTPIDIDGPPSDDLDRLPEGHDRVPQRRQHRLRPRDQLAEHLRVPPRGDELRLQRGDTAPTTSCRAPRSRATAPGRCRSPRCSPPSPASATIWYSADNDTDEEITVAEARPRDRLHPDREPPDPRRPRLRRPQARPDDRRRPRHHRAQHRPGGPRRLPLRPGEHHRLRRRALDLRRAGGPPERHPARLLQPPARPGHRPGLPALRRRPGRLGSRGSPAPGSA